jgi:SAM-dependent methyltransferase
MRPEDFEYLYQLEANFWWFTAMRQITDAILDDFIHGPPRRILDAGCGTGYNLAHYSKLGHDVFGLEIAPEAVAWVKKRGYSKLVQASVTDIPTPSETFDLVLSFDVLMQMPVEMSTAGIHEMYRVLKPGGRLFVRTAAYQWLHSSHDEDLHTIHRFGLGELKHKLTRAGFKVEHATYANTLLFPVVAIRRLLKRVGIARGTDVKPLPPGLSWVDPVFRTILASESAAGSRRIPLPFGLSAICYARK